MSNPRRLRPGRRARAVSALAVFAAFVVVLIPAGAAGGPGGGPSSSVKDYDACLNYQNANPCSTANLPSDASGVQLSLTITNRTESNTTIGSANLTAPIGFSIDLSSVSPSQYVGSNSTSSQLQLRNLSITPTNLQTFTFNVTTPCYASGNYNWNLEVKQSNDFSGKPGNDFVPVSVTGLASTLSTTAGGAGPATHFSVALPSSPFTATAGQAFTTTVSALDACGAPSTSYSGSATLSTSPALGNAPNPLSSAQKTPTITTNPITSWTNGVGTASITAVKTQSNISLSATDTANSISTTSPPTFNVQAAAPAQLAFSTQPPSPILTNATFAVGVSLEDAFGNPTAPTDATSTVNLTLDPPGDPTAGGVGAKLNGTIAVVPDSSGTASFTGLSVDTSGTGYTLTATYGSLTTTYGSLTTTSSAFDVFDKLADCTQSCSSDDASSTTLLSVNAPDTSGKLGIGLSTPPGSAPCYLTGATSPTTQTPIGSAFQISPPARTGGNDPYNIVVTLTLLKGALQQAGVGASKIIVCKNPSPSQLANLTNPPPGALVQVPACPSPAKKLLQTGSDFACIVSQTADNAGDAVITMLINSSDPHGITP